MGESIIRFAQQVPNKGMSQRDRDPIFPRELWRRCGEVEIQDSPTPKQYAGSGRDALTTIIPLEALGYGCHKGCLVFSFCAHLLSCVVPLWKLGSKAQKCRYLPDLCNRALAACDQSLVSNRGQYAPEDNVQASPVGYLHIYMAAVSTEEGKLYLCIAIDRPSKFGYAQLDTEALKTVAAQFLRNLIATVPHKLHTALTNNGIQFPS